MATPFLPGATLGSRPRAKESPPSKLSPYFFPPSAPRLIPEQEPPWIMIKGCFLVPRAKIPFWSFLGAFLSPHQRARSLSPPTKLLRLILILPINFFSTTELMILVLFLCGRTPERCTAHFSFRCSLAPSSVIFIERILL